MRALNCLRRLSVLPILFLLAGPAAAEERRSSEQAQPGAADAKREPPPEAMPQGVAPEPRRGEPQQRTPEQPEGKAPVLPAPKRPQPEPKRAGPAAAPRLGERSVIPPDARRLPPPPGDGDSGSVNTPANIADVQWQILGLEPCPSILPCPGAVGELRLPMATEFSAIGQVTLQVSNWAGYKALTFGVTDPGPDVIPGFRDPKSLDLQAVLWAASGSDLALYFSSESGPAMWDISVSVWSGNATAAETQVMRLRMTPPPKPGAAEAEPESDPGGDCDILAGGCGETKQVSFDGSDFWKAVEAASNSNGGEAFSELDGDCSFDPETAQVFRVVSLTNGICEAKVFRGGLSHSKMRKHCAIADWEFTPAYSGSSGIPGFPLVREILAEPQAGTRQKQFHLRLSGPLVPGTEAPFFQVEAVEVWVPEDSPLIVGSGWGPLRDYCFE